MNQPTIQDIQTAWTICIQCEGIAGSQSGARQDLQRIRNRKTTWIGKEENNLRISIDKYLRGQNESYFC